MILKNFWTLLKLQNITVIVNNNIAYFSSDKVIDTSGNTISNVLAAISSSSAWVRHELMNRDFFSNITPKVGIGTSEPNWNDYNLENGLPLNLSITSSNYVFDDTKKQTRRIFTITGTNTTNNEIIISEVGLIKNLFTSQTSDDTKKVLIVHNLLDDPITVSVGSDFNVVLEVSFN